MNLLLVALLGGCSGLRACTPMAVLCWFAWRGTLHFSGWRSFTASLLAVIIFTVFALLELAADKSPTAPARTALPGLAARAMFGAFAALLLAQPLLLQPATAMIAAAIGAIVGAYAGWFVRMRTVAALKSADWPVAVTEDAVTIGLSITFLHLMAVHSTLFLGNQGIGFGR
ncbi:DUF4126 family protein [Terriglobus sp. RCC_193]|uniref:DUF4126 family protein n=1 Tax=Terriglobus sp. RCC_193 TaxID=3239218 RepID=UPI0035250FB1